jgi:hypothetical protein
VQDRTLAARPVRAGQARSNSADFTGNPNRGRQYPSPDGEKRETTSLPLLCFGHGIQADEGSFQWAANLRKVWSHCFSERQGF